MSDQSITQSLRESVDRSRRELVEAVNGFLQRHPAVALERFHLPAERLTGLVPFHASDATAMLLRRWPPRGLDARTVSYLFCRNGDVRTAYDDRTVIPASSVASEISLCLWEEPWKSYAPRVPDRTEKVMKGEYAEFRRLHTDPQGRDLIAERLVAWLFVALAEEPGLMYGYRASPLPGRNAFRLTPFPKGEPLDNARKIDAWRR